MSLATDNVRSRAAALPYRTDTIVALATPPGRGGLAVVRLSGPKALAWAGKMCTAPLAANPRHAFHGAVTAPDNGPALDSGVITYFQAPASFTGEDVVEFSIHGGYVTPREVIRHLVRLGARQAEPGEFSMRAFLNGKMDLAEAEALNEVITSLSRRGQQAATYKLSGGLSREINRMRASLLRLLTLLEHELDFSEDELDATTHADIRKALAPVAEQVRHLQATAPYGRILRDGVRIILAGPPNAGKSSLFNALVGHEQAIVADLPGTTRDSLEAWIDIAGFPVCLVDTAGLQDTSDVLDRAGVERSRQQLAAADIVLLLDPDDPAAATLDAALDLDDERPPALLQVHSKRDTDGDPPAADGPIPVSVRRDNGLDLLLARLAQVLSDHLPAEDGAVVSSERQLAGLELALQQIESAVEQLDAGQSIDVISSEIRLAMDSLANIIGEVPNEEVLQRIFSEFCVGK